MIISDIKKRYSTADSVSSVIAVTTNEQHNPLIDGFDMLLLIITNDKTLDTSHYIKDGMTIQERWISPEHLERWIVSGKNRRIIQWILSAEIIIDKHAYIEQLRQRLMRYPQAMREQKLFIEFCDFLRRYLQSKQYVEQGQTLDAYSNVLGALHHWARICIIESGQHPELLVWKQLKQINLGVYKLYEELTQSLESLEQRVRLVLLACEFNVISKMEQCCKFLLDIIKSRQTPWGAEELQDHPTLKKLDVDLALALNKLQLKSLVQQVPVPVEHNKSWYELKYTC